MTDFERWLIEIWDGPVTHTAIAWNGPQMYRTYLEVCPDQTQTMTGTEFYHALWPLAEANEEAGIE
ncbi:hypothetical protein DBB29_08740 [Pandoraea cepalis]|uniref:Uncharacterized protein n=1 Tax=Pandoraea cepalis TaxID=2508294 RepID=A0AAW7MM97_9BURK|nr:hypothetical protein [Pandoraea cepalis]MDN4573660.1 hypothetical protein [Pandoraea cepalis]MDN4578202.1 hypothetical protein [Pandoraea cepalis]